MSDRELEIRLTGDASELTAATRTGAAGLRELASAGKQAADETAKGTASDAEATAAKRALGAAAREATEAERRAAAEAKRVIADAKRAEQQAMRAVTAEANQLKQAYRQLGPQITDVVTSLASGQPAWMVAIQQGGQIKDSFGGVGAALRGVLALVTPVVAGIGALAAAGAGVATAYYQGWAESKRFNDGMALSGNVAAITEGQFNGLVVTLSAARDASAGAVRELLQVLATGGEQTGSTIIASGRAALAMAKLNGQSAAENARAFEGMGESVSAWAAKANKAYNFLSAEQYRQIMALESQGRSSEAVRLTMEALAGTLESRTAPALGLIERALKAATNQWSSYWNAAKGVGRPETVEERLAEEREKLAKLQARQQSLKLQPFQGALASDTERRRSQLEAQIEIDAREAARNAIRAADRAAAMIAEQDAIARSGRAFQDTLLAIESAGSSRQLAQQQAALEERRALVERSYAQFALSAQAYRDQIVTIERSRLAAEEAAARQSVDIERRRVTKSEAEVNARNAAVTAAEAKLAELQGRRARLEADIASGKYDPKAREVIESPQAAFMRSEHAAGEGAAEQIRANAAATRELAVAQGEYWLQLQRTNDAQAQQNERGLAGMGRGDRARDQAAREAAILDRFNAARDRLDDERNAGRISETVYRERLAALRAYHNEALEEEARYQEARQKLEGDASAGFRRAFENYVESSRNAADQSERLWTNAVQGMEDSLVSFVATGKADFKSLANSIIADLIRIYVRQQLVGMVASMFGGGGATGTTGDFARMDRMGGLTGHTGGVVGREPMDGIRMMPASTWDGAPRLHTGRLANDEVAAILRRDESVLTPHQMRQLAPVGARQAVATTLNVNVINQTGQAAEAKVTKRSDGGIDVLLTAVKQSIAGDISSGAGEVTQALQGRYGLKAAFST